MNKSEMESHFNRLRELSQTIGSMFMQRPLDLSVFQVCVVSLEHVAPALQYWAKEKPGSDFFSVVPIRAIHSYGPAFFAHDAIQATCDHIRANRYLRRAEFPFVQMFANIEDREQAAVALWTWMENNPRGLERALWHETGISLALAVDTLGYWVEFGAVLRVPFEDTYRLSLATDISSPVTGMCPNCGAQGTARRELLYRSCLCQRCKAEVFYCLLSGRTVQTACQS